MVRKDMTQMELLREYNVISDRITEMAELCKKEDRARNEKEEEEYRMLVGEQQQAEMFMRGKAIKHIEENPGEKRREKAEALIQQHHRENKKTEVVFLRDIMLVSDIEVGGLVQLNVNDIIEPLSEGFILDKVGLPFQTGLSGDFVWPVYEMVEAKVMDEGVKLTDTKIPLSQLKASPQRVGIAVPVTNQTITQSGGYLKVIITKVMPTAIKQLLNKIVFSTQPVSETANKAGFYGPFVGLAKNPVALSSVPTFEELDTDLATSIAEAGIEGSHMCYVMSKRMESLLKAAPMSKEGTVIGPILQDGKIGGIPVYTTNCIRQVVTTYKKYTGSAWQDLSVPDPTKVIIEYDVYGDTKAHAEAKLPKKGGEGEIASVNVYTEFVGVGDFAYQPMGMFGSMRMIVDPYTRAREDATDFVLNGDFGTKTLQKKAFALGKVAPKA